MSTLARRSAFAFGPPFRSPSAVRRSKFLAVRRSTCGPRARVLSFKAIIYAGINP